MEGGGGPDFSFSYLETSFGDRWEKKVGKKRSAKQVGRRLRKLNREEKTRKETEALLAGEKAPFSENDQQNRAFLGGEYISGGLCVHSLRREQRARAPLLPFALVSDGIPPRVRGGAEVFRKVGPGKSPASLPIGPSVGGSCGHQQPHRADKHIGKSPVIAFSDLSTDPLWAVPTHSCPRVGEIMAFGHIRGSTNSDTLVGKGSFGVPSACTIQNQSPNSDDLELMKIRISDHLARVLTIERDVRRGRGLFTAPKSEEVFFLGAERGQEISRHNR